MFKNMKIAINEQQPLDEVVKELQRLGYETWGHFKEDVNAFTFKHNGSFRSHGVGVEYKIKHKPTTLTELKNMEQQQ